MGEVKVKPGDWICPSCGDHQFRDNEACKQCGDAKPDDVVVCTGNLLPGDWTCPGCNDHQFAKNEKCRQCGHARPKNAGPQFMETAKAAAKRKARSSPF